MAFSLSHGKELDVGQVGIDQAQLPDWHAGHIDPHQFFAPDRRHHPLELEIGSGKGGFLIQQAAGNPQINYLGIEYSRPFWRYAADRLRRHNLTNVRLIHAEAGYFLRNYLPDGCLRQVHVYFPDPWPKKRHHKRRLLQEVCLRELWRTLQPQGLLRVATDHAEYFQWILDRVAALAEAFESLAFQSPQTPIAGCLVGTNFELKYRRQGRPFYGLTLRKR